MKQEYTHINNKKSNVIRVDFRKGSLSIDFDPYFNGVREIHCRKCVLRKPRKGAMEMTKSWGYICKDCQESTDRSNFFQKQKKEGTSLFPILYPLGSER